MLELSSTDGHLAAVAQRQRSVLVLEEDPDLAEGLGAEDRERATRLLRAAVLDLPAGSWIPPSGEAGDFGLLVLDGLIGRNVALGKGVSVEIIGPGHLIRPWDDWFAQPMVETTVSWEVCEPATVAVLGR